MKRILLIIVIVSFFSCGSIKKDKTSIETETNSELNAGSNTARWINSSNWGLEPVDLSKPMIFTNSKGETETFTNTKVVYNNTHTKEIVKDTISHNKQTKIEVDDKNKKTDNTNLFLGIFGIAFFLIFLFLIFIVIYFGNKISALKHS